MLRKKKNLFQELKYKIAQESLQENVRISELCRHYEIYPVDNYRWKRKAANAILNEFKKSKKRIFP